MFETCPCGSGRELMRCCSAPLTDTELQYASADRERAIRKMQTVLDRPTSRRFWNRGIELFFADCLPDEDNEAEELLSHPNLQGTFSSYLYWDSDMYGDQALGSLVLEEFGRRLAPGERAFLRAGLASHWSVYEVAEVRPGEGVVLEDLWRPRRIWVKEHSASKQILLYDVLGGRIVKRPSGPHEFEGDILDFTCSRKAELLALVREVHAAEVAENPGISDRELFKVLMPTLVQFWVEEVASPRQMPQLHTHEGDPLHFCEALFSVGDRAALVRALDLADDLVRSSEGAEEWTWIEPAGTSDRVLGSLALAADTLRVEARSRERMARAKALLASLDAGDLRHLETTERSVEEVRAGQEDQAPPEPRAEVPPGVKKELVAKLMDEHYRRWFDMQLPALDGWTPRHAVHDPRMRLRVVDLLKGIANLEEHKRQRGELAYDSGWMWEELGLKRPGA